MKRVNKFLSILLTLIISIIPISTITASADDSATSGICGENLTWNLDESAGTLTISGEGEMEDYGYNNFPWEGNEKNITKIVICEGVTGISNYAFWWFESLVSVTIPNSVTTIGDNAFFGCSNLASVTIPDNVTKIGDSAFEDCYQLTNIIIPSSVITIGNRAFASCNSLVCVEIPNNVSTVGTEAFAMCKKLSKVTIGDGITKIEDYLFRDCYNLNSVALSDKVISIGEGAFSDCYNLTDVKLSDNLIKIGDEAFRGCGFNSLTIPDSVTTIGDYAFNECRNLTNILVDSNNNYFSSSEGVLFNKEKTTLIQYPIGNTRTIYIVPDGVAVIGKNAFDYCVSLTSIDICDSVTTIEDYAFYCCKNLKIIEIGNNVTSIGNVAFKYCMSLTDVIVPDSVISIGDAAFASCYSLKTATIGASVKLLDAECFRDCYNLINILVKEENKQLSSDVYGVLYNKDKTVLIKYPMGSEKNNYTIPNTVTTICHFAFQRLDSLMGDPGSPFYGWDFEYDINLTNVFVPSSVLTIEYFAFCANRGITELYYEGSENQWNTISAEICDEDSLNNTTIHFNSLISNEGIVISPESETTLPEDTIMNVILIEKNEESIIYDIKLTHLNSEVQLNGNIEVRIPAPDYLHGPSIKVYRRELNGSLTDMNAVYLNGYMVFKTNHFSEYVLQELSCLINIHEPSVTTIRNKDGIILHANVEGTAPAGSYIEWTASNNNFKTSEQDYGNSLKIISNNNGYTTFTATLYDANGAILATDSLEMRSKAGFFDKIGGFFRSLFGATKIYEY